MLNNKKLSQTIFLTRPLLPDLELVNAEIKNIFDSQWVTNMGDKHNSFELRLKSILKVPNVSLFNNGTIALLVALKALELPYNSEVITTPFTFAATPHCISWNNLKPVFCDIEPRTMCIDADNIESLITTKTSAIVAVHVYGFPCNVEKIDIIAKKYNLKVIYDAAHSFGCEIDGIGIGSFGDISMFSFHATKLFNSIEGGALSYNDTKLVKKIYNLRNFGIQSEELVEDIGINGKMNEIQAAIGLLNLDSFEQEREKRIILKKLYDNYLADIKGIVIPKLPDNIKYSYLYYPIIIENDYAMSRNELYDHFKALNIMTRKYFYPLCSDFECYKELASSAVSNLPIANDLKNKVLCLPFYGSLDHNIVNMICEEIRSNA